MTLRTCPPWVIHLALGKTKDRRSPRQDAGGFVYVGDGSWGHAGRFLWPTVPYAWRRNFAMPS